jgi:hypothetical protein
MLVYFTAIWYNLWPFGIIYGHLVLVIAVWCSLWYFGMHIFPVLVCLDKEKSGNPG